MKLIALIFFALLSLAQCRPMPDYYEDYLHNAGIPDTYPRPQQNYNRPDVQIDRTNYPQPVPASGIPSTFEGPRKCPCIQNDNSPYGLVGYNNPSPNNFPLPIPNWPIYFF